MWYAGGMETPKDKPTAPNAGGTHYTVRLFSSLPDEARAIREEVFQREQGFADEFDEIDGRAVHAVLYLDGEPCGTCRVFAAGGQARIGRVAVLRGARGKGAGGRLLAAAEEAAAAMGLAGTELAAQVRARGFYEKYGYAACSEPFDEEGCPHILMRKRAAAFPRESPPAM